MSSIARDTSEMAMNAAVGLISVVALAHVKKLNSPPLIYPPLPDLSLGSVTSLPMFKRLDVCGVVLRSVSYTISAHIGPTSQQGELISALPTNMDTPMSNGIADKENMIDNG